MRTRNCLLRRYFAGLFGCLFTGGDSLSQDIFTLTLLFPLQSPAPRVKVTAASGRGCHLDTVRLLHTSLSSSWHHLTTDQWQALRLAHNNQSEQREQVHREQLLWIFSISVDLRAGWRQDSDPMKSQYQRQPTNERTQFRTRGPASGGQSEPSIQVTWLPSTNQRPVFRARPRI